jgi:poly-gamma-glutamate synthesis protein (capsule biosynthesis protein)
MENQGAEFIVFYIHWGEEYQLSANTWRKSIAQKLSNLGVDIIIGSHPHVVQPIELIHSEDGENTTVCLYSTGNAVSNQRQEIMDSCPSGHTEDGLFFTYSLRKYGDEVTLESIDIIPTWVNKYLENGGYKYTIYPLDNIDKYGFNATTLSKAQKSLERTKQLVKAGLNECQKHIGCEVTL